MQQNKCRKLPPGDQMSNYAIEQRYLLAFSLHMVRQRGHRWLQEIRADQNCLNKC